MSRICSAWQQKFCVWALRLKAASRPAIGTLAVLRLSPAPLCPQHAMGVGSDGFGWHTVESQLLEIRLIIFLEICRKLWIDHASTLYDIENPAGRGEVEF
jgi:hypothetical protein